MLVPVDQLTQLAHDLATDAIAAITEGKAKRERGGDLIDAVEALGRAKGLQEAARRLLAIVERHTAPPASDPPGNPFGPPLRTVTSRSRP